MNRANMCNTVQCGHEAPQERFILHYKGWRMKTIMDVSMNLPKNSAFYVHVNALH
jgi:hypothetical protein